MSNPNPELQLAHDFVQYTGSHIFLTGKAGTGKTTFLHNLQGQTDKRMIITAPTGVAAMNAGGVTLHSFFQLPFGPFLPGSEAYERNSQRHFRFSKEKKQIIASLDLLVIDEISMVRADLLDAVDSVLRRYRRNELPFGGVQLLMIGDLHQLSPVAKPSEWKHLQAHYDSVYFFSSKALSQTELLTIELQHIYRQSDEVFIRLLNKVRNNRLDTDGLELLNECHQPDFLPEESEGYITLTTHNNSALRINHDRLDELDVKACSFHANIEGDFPEHIFPTPARLTLKEGAQVMFVRNDVSPDKLYFNGKIGRITRIIGKTIFVQCPEDKEEIEVDPVTWENIKYIINDEVKEIEEDIVGKFEQFPLKLAWAITIHKSQGLTFEKAIIDAGAAFTHGQVYVALSRCKTLEGMVLISPITSAGVDTDAAVLDFDKLSLQNPPSQSVLRRAKLEYQQKLLLDCFDFTLLGKRLGFLLYLLQRNEAVLQLVNCENRDEVETSAKQSIFEVSENFRNQLRSIFVDSSELLEEDEHVQERSRKASGWFQTKFEEIFASSVLSLQFETDNKELRKKLNNVLNNTRKEIAVKTAGIKSCADGFSVSAYLRAITVAEIDFQPAKLKKQKAPVYTKEDIDHPELFESIRAWRTEKAAEKSVGAFAIMHQRVLIQIVMQLPGNTLELKKISGVGKKTIENYGEDILKIVADYQGKAGK